MSEVAAPLSPMTSGSQLTDREFVDALRSAVDGYYAAVDAWEAKYRSFYRLPGLPPNSHPDLIAELQLVAKRRRAFEALLPRARRLCLKHQVREAFSGLLRINLGLYAPQERSDSAIGRSERNAVTESLMELQAGCQEWTEAPAEGSVLEPDEPRAKGGLLRRLVNFFY